MDIKNKKCSSKEHENIDLFDIAKNDKYICVVNAKIFIQILSISSYI